MTEIEAGEIGDDDPTVSRLRAELDRTRRQLEEERSSRQDSERATEEAVRQLSVADRAKSVFLSSVSHELRTPLTAIAGFSALLLQSYELFDDEQRVDFIERIHRNAESLHQMIEEVLDFARLDQDDISVRLEPVDIVAVARTVLGLIADRVAPFHVVQDVAPAQVLSERRPLQRILTNVVVNATQYSPQGTRLALTGRRIADGRRYLISVDDQGPGIPADEVGRVFEPFFRGSQAHVIKTHGSGVGLTVARRFVTAMGGRIDVCPAEGGGTRIEIELDIVE